MANNSSKSDNCLKLKPKVDKSRLLMRSYTIITGNSFLPAYFPCCHIYLLKCCQPESHPLRNKELPLAEHCGRTCRKNMGRIQRINAKCPLFSDGQVGSAFYKFNRSDRYESYASSINSAPENTDNQVAPSWRYVTDYTSRGNIAH